MLSDFVFNHILQENKFEYFWMGIVVQEFIYGNLSGIIFTVDSLSQNNDCLCFNVCKGICKNAVEGNTISSVYKVSKSSHEIIERFEPENSPVLSLVQIQEIIEQSMKIEKLFNCYQDIEWTMQNNVLFILQARAITKFKNKQFPITWSNIKAEA